MISGHRENPNLDIQDLFSTAKGPVKSQKYFLRDLFSLRRIAMGVYDVSIDGLAKPLKRRANLFSRVPKRRGFPICGGGDGNR